MLDLRAFYDAKRNFFAQRELSLLRNTSRGHGHGFIEAGNFFPGFILWLLDGGKQYVTFVDPKGLRNLEGCDDPKIRCYGAVKELEARLGDPNVILNSCIIANTPFQPVRWWTEDLSKDQFTKCHVLFQKDDRQTCIEHRLTTVNARAGRHGIAPGSWIPACAGMTDEGFTICRSGGGVPWIPARACPCPPTLHFPRRV